MIEKIEQLNYEKIKNQIFGPFLNWLKKNKIQDDFQQSAWQVIILNELLNRFIKEEQRDQSINQILLNAPVNILQQAINERKEKK